MSYQLLGRALRSLCWVLGLLLILGGPLAAAADEEKTKAGSEKAAGTKSKDGEETNSKEAGSKDKEAHGKGAGGHGEHDPTNLLHGNATPQLENMLEFRSDLAIYTVAVFLLLLTILRVFAWGPIMEGLEKREKGIANQIAEAQRNAELAKEQAEYEAKLAAATQEARDLVAQARKDAEAAKDRILAEAEADRQRDRERLLADIETAKNLAVSEVAEQGTRIAVSLAGQIVRRELKADDHAQLIQESLQQFPSSN